MVKELLSPTPVSYPLCHSALGQLHTTVHQGIFPDCPYLGMAVWEEIFKDIKES